MKKSSLPKRFGLTLFCDDIRNEVDGKVTYVGVYNGGSMIFASPFPAQIPKLGISITLALAPEEETDYSFEVYMPGDLEGAPSISFSSPLEKGAAPRDTSVDDPRFAIKVQGVFSPVVIQKEGYIEVRAVKNNEYLRVGRLKVSSTVPTNSE
jgi:hypothetical protein